MNKLFILIMFAVSAQAQFARPTYNPFNNGMMPFYGGNQMMPQQGFQFPNNTNHPLNFHRPNYGFQQPNNYGFQNGFQRPNNYGFQNGFPQPNNNTLQQGNAQTNTAPLFTRRFHLNNGYLYGRPTLYYDSKTNKMQPWVRKNLR
tara:strand:+ start:426 stop:860 length:435 start_codon:yes stop_codon:yes gene_type:complete